MKITHDPRKGAICSFVFTDDAQLPNGMKQKCETRGQFTDDYADLIMETGGLERFCKEVADLMQNRIASINQLKRMAVEHSQSQSVIINPPIAEGEVTL